jgi:hypothetical protein
MCSGVVVGVTGDEQLDDHWEGGTDRNFFKPQLFYAVKSSTIRRAAQQQQPSLTVNHPSLLLLLRSKQREDYHMSLDGW